MKFLLLIFSQNFIFFRCSDADGSLKIAEISGKPLKREMLDTMVKSYFYLFIILLYNIVLYSEGRLSHL